MPGTKDQLDGMHQENPPDIDNVDCETGYEVGQDNITPFGLDIHNPVFLISAVSVMAFVAVALFNQEASAAFFA